MKKLILATIALIITNTALMANDTEQAIEKQLDKNVDRIEKALKKYKEMKAAIKKDDVDRESILRKACSHMKNETLALSESISCMDFQLELTQVRKSGNEIDHTRKSIKDLRKQIEELKKGLENNSVETLKVATR